MTIEQLRQFVGVVENMSFTKASEALYSHQSTISKSVSKLEKEFGVAFFVRAGNSLKLTYAGERFYASSRKLIAEFEELGKMTRQIASGHVGTITFSSIEVYLYLILKPMNDFMRANPAVEFVFNNCSYGNISNILGCVGSGEADVGMVFSIYIPEDHGDFEVVPVMRERFCLIMSKGHPLASRERVGLDELRRAKFLLSDHIPASIVARIDDAIGSRFGSPPRRLERLLRSGSPGSFLMQIMNGEYVSVSPRLIAEQAGPDLACRDLEEVDLSFDLCLVYRKDNANPSLARLMGELESRREPGP